MPDIEIVDAQLPATRAAAQSPALVYLARLAPGSRRTMAQALNTIADLAHPGTDAVAMPWHRLDYIHTAALRAQLADRYAPATANKMLSALRGVLLEAWRLGLMSAEQSARARDVKAVRGTRIPKGRALDGREISALLDACRGDGHADRRDRALLAVLYTAGLRRSEAVGLDVTDYNAAAGTLAVRIGKGNKARIAYLNAGAQRHLDTWLAGRGCHDNRRGCMDIALFIRVRRGDHMTDERLTDQAVRYILRQRCEQAGVAECSPHDLRRSFCSGLLGNGADLATVQALMGHSSPTTTVKYDRRGDQRKRDAVNLLDL